VSASLLYSRTMDRLNRLYPLLCYFLKEDFLAIYCGIIIECI
jgi:hypothetical protein